MNRPTRPVQFLSDQRTRLLSRPAEWAASDARVDPRVALGSIVAMWAIYFLITTFLAWLTSAPDAWGMAERRGVVVLAGAVFTMLLYLFLRRYQPRSFAARLGLAFGAAVPLTIAYAIVNMLVFFNWLPSDEAIRLIVELKDKFPENWRMILILDGAIRWYFFFSVWAALYVALGYANEMRAAEDRANAYRLEAKNAQLRALHYQVNPHFLFNTLNSLSALVMRGAREPAEQMILNLSSFLRSSLTVDPEQDISLAEEIALQQLYLDIEQVRFPDRLNVRCDIPASLEQAMVPGQILQPVIENVVKYGVAPARNTIDMVVTAAREDDMLVLTITNTLDPEAPPPPPGTGLGLSNVRERLVMRFGARGGCDWGKEAYGRFAVRLWLPLMLDDGQSELGAL